MGADRAERWARGVVVLEDLGGVSSAWVVFVEGVWMKCTVRKAGSLPMSTMPAS